MLNTEKVSEPALMAMTSDRTVMTLPEERYGSGWSAKSASCLQSAQTFTHVIHVWIRVVDRRRAIAISPASRTSLKRTVGHDVRRDELVAVKVVRLEVAKDRASASSRTRPEVFARHSLGTDSVRIPPFGGRGLARGRGQCYSTDRQQQRRAEHCKYEMSK